MTQLLSSTYTRDNIIDIGWVKRHFQEMALYIQERARWVITPKDGTLERLRRDFYRLAAIYVTGDYGAFTWPDIVTQPEAAPPPWTQRLILSLPRFSGVVLPLTLIGLYLWQPNFFPFIKLNSDIATLIFIAWLLLGLDAYFKLGIVSGLASLAKGIKELA